MKIFFNASIRGGRRDLPLYKEIVEELKKYGEVITPHVADETLDVYGETQYTNTEIFEQAIKRVFEANIIISEVTTPSLGVGYIIAEGVHQKKKQIALYSGKYTDKLSAMIKGNLGVPIFVYNSNEELQRILKENL